MTDQPRKPYYRIEDTTGRVWTGEGWTHVFTGGYQRYKTAAIAVAAGRRIRAPLFHGRGAKVVVDSAP